MPKSPKSNKKVSVPNSKMLKCTTTKKKPKPKIQKDIKKPPKFRKA
jgi:hypothetical protein